MNSDINFVEYAYSKWKLFPNKKAFIYLANGEEEANTITYGQLLNYVSGTAGHFSKELKIRSGDVVILALPTGFEFIVSFFACLAIGAVPIPYKEQLKGRDDKLDRLINSSNAKFILVRGNQAFKYSGLDINDFTIAECKIVDSLRQDAQPIKNHRGVAYLQYTSGSTSEPKGVVITHENIFHQMQILEEGFSQTQDSIMVGWLPLYHDQGLVSSLLLPAYLGATSILMSPVAFIQKPIRWLKAISKYKATTSGGPNFAYSKLGSINIEPNSGLDLSSWDVVFCGAEPIRIDNVNRFFNTYYKYGLKKSSFMPAYGMAEGTLVVTRHQSKLGAKTIELAGERKIFELPGPSVSCGTPQKDMSVRVVNPDTNVELGDGEIGEIWIKGGSVSPGYWDRGDISSERFCNVLYPSMESGYFATGDLGMLVQNELYVTGRISDCFKFHGKKVFYTDIEHSVRLGLNHLQADNGTCIVFQNPSNLEEIILLVYLKSRVRGKIDMQEESNKLFEQVSLEHALQLSNIFFIKERLPLTTSGKLQRSLAIESFLQKQFSIIEHMRYSQGIDLESADNNLVSGDRYLLNQFFSELGMRVDHIRDYSSKLSELGLTSIDFIKIQHSINGRNKWKVELSEVMQKLTISQLIEFLREKKDVRKTRSVSRAESVTITPQMSDLVASTRTFDASSAYLYRTLHVKGKLNVLLLERAFKHVMQRHLILLSQFVGEGKYSRLSYLSDSSTAFRIKDKVGTSAEYISSEVVQLISAIDRKEINLNHLLCVFKYSEEEYYLFFAFHHGISDFWSLSIYLNELLQEYQHLSTAEFLENPVSMNRKENEQVIQFHEYQKDYSEYLSSRQYLSDKEFWEKHIADKLMRRETPANLYTIVEQANFSIPVSTSHQVLIASKRNSVTPNAYFATAFELALSIFSYSRNNSYQFALGNRVDARYAQTIGLFANIITATSDIRFSQNASDCVVSNYYKLLRYLEHQRFPFSSILGSNLALDENISSDGLFSNILYAFHVNPCDSGNPIIGNLICGLSGAYLWNDLSVQPVSIVESKSICSFNFHVLSENNQYSCTVECDETHAPFVDQFLKVFNNLLLSLTRDKDETSKIIDNARRTYIDIEPQKLGTLSQDVNSFYLNCIKEVMSESAEPFILYANDIESPVSRREFYLEAEILAKRIVDEYNVRPGEVIAVEASRSKASSLCFLAVMLAGCVYMPLDFQMPIERESRILERAKPSLVIGFDELVRQYTTIKTINLQKVSLVESLALRNTKLPEIDQKSPAYLIFTSGSSGFPKGVLISHEALHNRLIWMNELLQVDRHDVFMHKTSLAFDVSVWEVLLPMMSSSKTVIVPNGIEKKVFELDNLMVDYRVSIVHFVPTMFSLWNRLSECDLSKYRLRACICSGEQLLPTHVKGFYERFSNVVELYNFYGPTEAAIDVTYAQIKNEQVNIGSAASGCETYVLDVDRYPLPDGISGELAIGGIQVGLGYVAEEELTNQSFMEFSYSPSGRVYMTGDFAKKHTDGNIELFGRIDNQVKLNGYRIELDEIVLALTSIEFIDDAAVICTQNEDKIDQLVAFIACRKNDWNKAEINRQLAKLIPNYMLPGSMIWLEELPILGNGKVDRAQLKKIFRENRRRQADRTDKLDSSLSLDSKVIKAWEIVLGVKSKSLDDDFFVSGGDSIKALQFSANLRDLGILIRVEDVYKFRTINQLITAAHKTKCKKDAGSSIEPFSMISPIDIARIPKEQLTDAYPLSSVQRSIIYQYLNSSSYEIYVTTIKLGLTWSLEAFKKSIDILVFRHPFLRASIQLDKYQDILQFIHESVDSPVKVVDFSDLSESQQKIRFEEWIQDEKRNYFEWHKAPLWRFTIHLFAKDRFRVTFSEVSMDGWCVSTVLSELLNNYSQILEGKDIDRTPVSCQYADFVKIETTTTSDHDHRDYWVKKIRSNNPTILKQIQQPNQASQSLLESTGRKRISCKLDSTSELFALAARCEVSIKHVLMAVHTAVIATLNGTNSVCSGMEVNGRLERKGGDEVVGVFNNMVPLFYDLTGFSWIKLIQHSYNIESEILPFRRFPYTEMHKLNGGVLFDTLFVFTHFHNYSTLVSNEQIAIYEHYASDQTYIPLTAHFNLSVDKSDLFLHLDYEQDFYSFKEAQRITNYYKEAIRQCVRYSSDLVLNRSLLGVNEYITLPRQVKAEFKPVQYCIARALEKNANKPAVSKGNVQYRYSDIDKFSAIISQILTSKKAKNVIVWVDNDIESVVAILACIRSGCTYIPIQKSTPSMRVLNIVSESNPGYQISSQDTELFDGVESIVVDINDLERRTHPGVKGSEYGVHDIAYIIYTSGTTGKPKGVQIPNNALAHYLQSASALYCSDEFEAIPLVSSLAFDMSVTSLYLALMHGKEIKLYKNEEFYNLIHSDSDLNFNFIKLTPTQLELINEIGEVSNRLDSDIFSKKQIFILGGEALEFNALRHIKGAVYNEYGPTEATVGCSVFKYQHGSPKEYCMRNNTLSIGMPMGDSQLLVLDESLRPVPPGTIGELFISGTCLSQGYFNDPKLTAQSFVPNPYASSPGIRMYRTGDLVIQTETGLLYFVERIDRQTKLNGLRIEMEEIESEAVKVSSASRAIALVEEVNSRRAITLFLIGSDPHERNIQRIREELTRRLPGYMLPSKILFVDNLPMTASGKLDYEELHQVSLKREEVSMEEILNYLDELDEFEVDNLLNQQNVSIN